MQVLLGVFWVAAVICGVFMLMAVLQSAEQFVISDSRFILEGPRQPDAPSPNFRLEGLSYTSELQVTSVFARDFGRSLYLCPIAERRRQLLAIDWVKDASILRIWPDTLAVRITERVPVAFVQTPGRRGLREHALIDEEGVLLNPLRAVNLRLPVLTGISRSEPEERRRRRVGAFLRLRKEVGPLMDKISEVDLTDLDNLQVTHAFDGRATVLMLGNKDFKRRLESFLENQAEIRRRLPEARTLDMRISNRIIAVENSDNGQ
ncbi:MAG: cell division protein FtsQ/DivIB [Bryobacteraceae bacterium]